MKRGRKESEKRDVKGVRREEVTNRFCLSEAGWIYLWESGIAPYKNLLRCCRILVKRKKERGGEGENLSKSLHNSLSDFNLVAEKILFVCFEKIGLSKYRRM